MNITGLSLSHRNMTTSVEETPLAEIEALVKNLYGIPSRCSRISCERDELFQVTSLEGQKFILRLSNPADDPSTIDMQIQALAWIAKTAPALPVPALIPFKSGESALALEVGGNPSRIVWMTSFLDGTALPKTQATSVQLRNIGTVLAQLGLGLQGYDHKGAHRILAWDLQQAAACREMLPPNGTSPDAKPWDLVRQGFDYFDEVVCHRLANLRRQVIHADFNPHNILMAISNTDLVAGILDFGDMVSTQLVSDIAIAASYHTDGEHPLDKVVELLKAYNAVLPLMIEEVDLLYDLIITRLCTAIAITEFRARLYPANRDYILKNTGTAWRGLERLVGVSRPEAIAILRNACHLE